MVLKQRFADGRTNYIDIGNDFLYIQRNSPDFETLAQAELNTDAYRKACIGFVCYDKKSEPIYEDFQQWVYSNDGQLFLTLV